jgi:hypothetical protein
VSLGKETFTLLNTLDELKGLPDKLVPGPANQYQSM